MSRFLGRHGADCTVLTLRIGLDEQRVRALEPAHVVAVDWLWKRFFVPRIKWKTIHSLVVNADMIHLIGHWGVLNALVYLAARLNGKPYVVCPAGALPLFGRSAWLKRLYNLFVGHAMLRNAAGWIAVTPAEFPHFENYGIPASRVTVIPNGVSAEAFAPIERATFLRNHGLADAPMILFMGRLNPIKGPDLLLEAFSLASGSLAQHQLVFAGPDGGLLPSLRARAEELGLDGRVHFLGHVEGAAKKAAYCCAQLLVVPSRQEAMSIVALEAGFYGTPVLLTDQCGFKDIGAIDSRLEVRANPEALAEGLTNLLSNPAVLEQIAPAWKDFVMTNYSWDVIAPRYLRLYRGILAGWSRS